MRVVLDTNVFISGIFWEGNYCSKVIDFWKEKKIVLICSLEIIQELMEVMRDFKIRLDEELVQAWAKLILEEAVIVDPQTKLEIIKEDPDDNKFIEAALSGRAEFIISQDKHLLKIKEYEKIKIITPQEFLEVVA
ncbi:MAG: putative toxin-antitoxin system toxin component, PIN family [Candidatus Woesearchaeota archaeon]